MHHGVGDKDFMVPNLLCRLPGKVKVDVHVVHVDCGVHWHFVFAEFIGVVEGGPIRDLCNVVCDRGEGAELVVVLEHPGVDLRGRGGGERVGGKRMDENGDNTISPVK